MEINCGDAHFRRSDNGSALYNPFIGNYILDAFATEIGGEVYLKTAGVIAIGAITGGETRGTVVNPGQRGPTFIGKVGVDRPVTKDSAAAFVRSTVMIERLRQERAVRKSERCSARGRPVD